MKDSQVIISDDRIFSPDGRLNSGIVMDKIAKPLTDEFCKVVGKSRGHILDIGFGLGYSANNFYNMGVESYTCIELNKTIYTTALEWAKGKPNVEIIFGDWIDIIPLLNKKFDGIFMDTYEDVNYSKFEDYAKMVSNENCCLSIWEYPSNRNIEELNYKKVPIEQHDYPLLLKPFHEVSWTYYVAGEFRKYVYFENFKKILSDDLCSKIIEDNKNSVELRSDEALIDDITHRLQFKSCIFTLDTEVQNIINQNVYSNFKPLNFKEVTTWFVKYEEGDGYDRHVESIKGLPIDDEEQVHHLLQIDLNDDFKGGEVEIYDSWLDNDRHTYSIIKPKKGDAIQYKPYQHATFRKITKGVKYQLIILPKHKHFKKRLI